MSWKFYLTALGEDTKPKLQPPQICPSTPVILLGISGPGKMTEIGRQNSRKEFLEMRMSEG